MQYKKIGLEKPVYIFILVLIVLFSYSVLSHYPPESKIQTPYTIDDIDNMNQPNDVNNIESINDSVIDVDNVVYNPIKVNEVITNE